MENFNTVRKVIHKLSTGALELGKKRRLCQKLSYEFLRVDSLRNSEDRLQRKWEWLNNRSIYEDKEITKLFAASMLVP